MRKTTLTALIVTGLFAMLVTSGCYTKFYRPGMEGEGPWSASQLYDRYDSSAIDTTLTRQDWYPEYYPDTYYDNGWYDWGSYRGQTRWGFDFYNFSPGYYHSYYGYNDYYGNPWWNRYNTHRPWWYYGGGGSSGPSEPPSQRDGRRTRDSYTGGGTYGTPPAPASGGGVYANPTPPAQPTPAPDARKNQNQKKSSDEGSTQKRTGKRAR